jgi:hypothetical protein
MRRTNSLAAALATAAFLAFNLTLVGCSDRKDVNAPAKLATQPMPGARPIAAHTPEIPNQKALQAAIAAQLEKEAAEDAAQKTAIKARR